MLLIDTLNQLGHKVRQLEESGTVTLDSMKASMGKFVDTYGSVSEKLQELPDRNFVGVARTMTARLENIIREFEVFILEEDDALPSPVEKSAVDQDSMFARLHRVNKAIANAPMPKERRMATTQFLYTELESWSKWQLDALMRLVPLCK